LRYQLSIQSHEHSRATIFLKPLIKTLQSILFDRVVDDDVNGYLCKPRDAEDPALKMRQMSELPATARSEMGRLGRQKMEREFDEKIVIGKYLAAIAAISR
jgi:glycosyltransferase involved in cell wall biosynthesis